MILNNTHKYIPPDLLKEQAGEFLFREDMQK